MKTTFLFFLGFALLFSLENNLNAGALDNWSNKNPAGGQTLNEVAYGANIFVVVGNAGTILTSTDTTNWIAQTSGSPENLYGVTYANGIFVAVGDLGALLTSPDGTNWLVLDSITGHPLRRINYASGNFVAVGDAGTILTSTDGANWTQQTTPTTNSLAGITFASGKFVAVGGLGTILTSTNGTNWTSQISGIATNLAGVSYGQSTFVAVGAAGTILTSPNASSWTPQTSGTNLNLFDIIYTNGNFVIVGGSQYEAPYGPNSTAILTSSNGTSWTANPSPMPHILNGVGFDGGAFVAAGQQDTVLISTNGSQWSCRAFSDVPSGIYSFGPSQCAYGNGTFVLSGYYTPFFTSPDGVSWTAQWPSQWVGTDYSAHLRIFAQGLFYAIGPAGLYASSNGVTWTLSYSQSFSWPVAIAYGNGRFVMVEFISSVPQLDVFTSPDGTNWTARIAGNNINGTPDIAFGNGVFVLPAFFITNSTEAYVILTSTNGVSWQTNYVNYSGAEDSYQNQIVFGNGIFLFATENGIFTSQDGASWQKYSTPSGNGQFNGNVAFGNGEFIISTSNGIATSVDGVSWVNHDLTASFGQVIENASLTTGASFMWLNSMVFGNGLFVAVNSAKNFGGTIITSATLQNPQLGGGQILFNNTFQLSVTGQTGHNYAIAATTNFTTWSGVTNLISTNSVMKVVDPAASGFKYRYYQGIED